MIKNIIIGASFVAAVSALCITLINSQGKDKQVYIDMGKIYEEFKLTTELNEDLEKVLKAKKTISDSLYEQVRMQTVALKSKPKQSLEEMANVARLEEKYIYKQQEFEKENQTLTAQYSSKIWSQLNQYIADYGAEKKYVFIFGANGQGSIMYADKTYNITEEVIKYVNGRYEDKIQK